MSQKFTIKDDAGGLAVCGEENIPAEVIVVPRAAPNARWNVQSVHPMRANGSAIGRGGGMLADFSWTVARTHANVAAAHLFMRDHAGLIPQLGVTHLTWELNGTLAQSDGAISALDWQPAQMPGLRTVVTYHWTGTLFVAASLGN